VQTVAGRTLILVLVAALSCPRRRVARPEVPPGLFFWKGPAADRHSSRVAVCSTL